MSDRNAVDVNRLISNNPMAKGSLIVTGEKCLEYGEAVEKQRKTSGMWLSYYLVCQRCETWNGPFEPAPDGI